MMLWLLLTAVVATDVAVAVMFVAMRRRMAALAPATADAEARDVADPVARLRVQADQLSAAIGRERVELNRMLTDLDGGAVRRAPAPLPVQRETPKAAPTRGITRRDVLDMAAEGLSMRSIAARSGMSVEEVRLMLALEDEAA